ncbi:MAG TPA: type I glutamate--ammonia ligase [Chloroflexi bacterium]|jgi:glutamine synthetase|nr:type I glutamate--ammonia ligase [Chloroflexota bacterium]
MAQNTQEDIRRRIHDKGIHFINLQFTDIVGMVKSVTITVNQLDSVLANGMWFDGSSIEGFVRVSESDMLLVPDLDSFAVIPWQTERHATARMICDVYTTDGELFAGSPRSALARVMAECAELGYGFCVGPELEFFLFETDNHGAPDALVPHDQAGYFDATADRGTMVRDDMITAVEAFGIAVEAGHHEVAAGQHEIDFRYGDAIRTADNTVTLKYVFKAIARQHGLYATFMPKPIRGIAGSGMHVHQSMYDLETGKNAFYDPADPYGLSKLAKQFLAGQLAHARGMTAILAPLVNSYKRLVPGYEAPVYVSWARINRSALIRVPRASTAEAHRLELRCPDPSCNPYLAFAVMLKCGLDGIRNDLPLPDATEENLYESKVARQGLTMLPGTLREAIDELQKDTVVQEALGPHIYERFAEAKLREWEDYSLEVTPWEIDRYLHVF